MAIKTLFTYDYGEESMNKIKELGYDIISIREKDAVYDKNIEDVEVLVCYNPFQTLDIRKMKKLKWIQLSSAGIDQLPLEYVRNSGIIITNNRGGYSIPIGEWIVLKILELLKHSAKLYENQKNRLWKMDTTILELCGKTISFVGTGDIAKEAARRLRGFDVEILGLNTSGRQVEYFDKCYSSKDIKGMLSVSDIVVITIPYTNDTHHLIDDEKFKMMKDKVCIINVARGSIMNEKDLIRNIEQGKIYGAALDVVEEEPLSSDNPLWNFQNVIITPHNSWMSEMRNTRRFNMIYNNMKKYAQNEKLINIVDINKGY
ncbi:phosphoglycerate dehydrogenase [Clostridiaceae bacterium UIB06]|uniref:Phosphoglycerate dehydrogenase n=1 Tax=Clostridium thailandense TaxID=2794346 RepID=A0A949X416_9CLOT|nr:phosphoglycerate dehydrogenase [Clostridium thailandense]MBV7273273.1 phosphoglycerate dehydrogenase [Clostridium thailandense]MCH5137298.1 phosphoglycerate dehydrogenase [Clostridiaceae bacterium UIB06]